MITFFVICLMWPWLVSEEKKLMTVIGIVYLMELPAAAISYFNPENPTNIWYYNLVLTGVYAMYIAIYNKLFITKSYANAARIIAILFILAHMANMQFGQQMNNLCSYSLVPANIVLALLAFLHLREVALEMYISPFMRLSTWFSAATFVYFSGTVPVMGVLNYWTATNTNIADNLYIINDILNVMFFVIIIAGLLWTKTRQIFYTS